MSEPNESRKAAAAWSDEQIEGLVNLVKMAELLAEVLGIKPSEAMRAQLKMWREMQKHMQGSDANLNDLMAKMATGKPS